MKLATLVDTFYRKNIWKAREEDCSDWIYDALNDCRVLRKYFPVVAGANITEKTLAAIPEAELIIIYAELEAAFLVIERHVKEAIDAGDWAC